MPEVNVDGSIHFVAQGVTLEDYACTAIAVLVFYDYFLTLDLEVQNIWTKKFRGPTLIFFLNRYLCIGLALALLLPTETQLVYTLQAIFGSALGIILALFFALRTYAISNCKLSVFLIVFMAYIPGFAMNLCTMLLKDIPATLGINEMAPLFFTLFDCLVLLLSLWALWRRHDSLRSDKMETLSAFLLQHGILYFVLLLILNMPQVIMTNVLQQPLNEGVMYTYSSILVSRFMLRLREASSTLPRYNTPIPGVVRRWSSLSREMVIGNLAEPLVCIL